MTQGEYLTRFAQITHEMLRLTSAKNSDYADEKNAFANFEAIDRLTSGRISIADGILIRMTDKLSRIVNLTSRIGQVKAESISDTLTDLAVYSIILRIYLEEQLNEYAKVSFDQEEGTDTKTKM